MNQNDVCPSDQDSLLIKNLLDASEKHNKNLNEQIVILKKNIEEEKSKVAKLTKENGELKRELGQKQMSLNKTEKELQISKQNEQKQNNITKSLQDQLEKQRLLLINQKTKVEDNFILSQNNESQIGNLAVGGLVERKNFCTCQSFNNNNLMEQNDVTSLNTKKSRDSQIDKKPNQQILKELESQLSNPSLKTISSSKNIYQKNSQKFIQTSRAYEKENSIVFTKDNETKKNEETTDKKRKPFYSIQFPSLYDQNQQKQVNGKKNINNSKKSSLHQDQVSENSSYYQQKTKEQDIQADLKQADNLRGISCNELESFQQTANAISSNVSTNVCSNKKDSLGTHNLYNSKSAIQSKINLNISSQSQLANSIIQNSNQLQFINHSRQASESFSQKFNQQIAKNTSITPSRYEGILSSYLQSGLIDIQGNNTQLEYISERGVKSKTENDQEEYSKKRTNSAINYFNSKQELNSIFQVNTPLNKTQKNKQNSIIENQKSETNILLRPTNNQSQTLSSSIKNKNIDDKITLDDRNIKSQDKNEKIETHSRKNSQFNQVGHNIPYNIGNQSLKKRQIFSDQTSSINSQINIQKLEQTSIENTSLQFLRMNPNSEIDKQEDSKQFIAGNLSNYCNKKKIEEQVKSPKFLLKDTIDLQFQKGNYGSQSNNKYSCMNIKNRFENLSNNDLYYSKKSFLPSENQTQSIQLSQNQNNKSENSIKNGQKETLRSLSNQSKTPQYNNDKSKKEEDVTITVEDILDTIANVDDDADEAANLENLSGSHFKFVTKNSSKNQRIKTEQYFSRIENPSIQTLNKKMNEQLLKQCHQQQKHQQNNPSLQDLINNNTSIKQNQYNNTQKQNNNQISDLYDPYSVDQKQVNKLLQNDLIHQEDLFINFDQNPLINEININTTNTINQIQIHDSIRLNTDEGNRSIYDKHQSVEIYNQINNKMTNFKYQSQLNGVIPTQMSQNSQRSIHQNPIENILERKIKNKYSIHEKKEPGKMKKYLEENQINDIGNRIFEGLMIYGPDKNQIKNLKSTTNKEMLRQFLVNLKYNCNHKQQTQVL